MLKSILSGIVWASISIAWLSAPSLGQGNGHGKHQGQGREKDNGLAIVFSHHDRDLIRVYFRDRYSNLPPGLAKRNGNLPPGLQKHLERNGTLPPGLQKRLEFFPQELERQLPRLPAIYRRGVIGADVVILDSRTQRIMDIIHDIYDLARH